MVAPMIGVMDTQVPFAHLMSCDYLSWITMPSDQVQKVNLWDRPPIGNENWQGWGTGLNHKRDLSDLGGIFLDLFG